MKPLVSTAALAALAALLMPLPALAAGDPVLGKKQFGPCTVCHKVEADAPDGVGPNLFGVYGSKAATRRTKFAYSPALKGAKISWDDTSLDSWIKNPGEFVKGTKMEFIGVPRQPTRDNIIAYLKTLK